MDLAERECAEYLKLAHPVCMMEINRASESKSTLVPGRKFGRI